MTDLYEDCIKVPIQDTWMAAVFAFDVLEHICL